MFRGVKLKDILNISVLKQKYHFQGPKNDQLIDIRPGLLFTFISKYLTSFRKLVALVCIPP